MSFLKKLLGRNREASLSTRIVRLPRLVLVPLHLVRFQCTEPQGVGTLSVLNLSLSGMGFQPHDQLRELAPGSKIQGFLQIEEERFPLSVELVYTSEQMTGGRFLDVPEDLKARILRYFVAEFAAIEMVDVKDSVLAAEPEGSPHFLVGKNQCELYFVEKDSKLVWFHLTFLGNYIEGDRSGKLREGTFEEAPRRAYKDSTVIRSMCPLSLEMGELVLKFLANVRSLEPGIKAQLNALIQTHISGSAVP